MSDSQAPYIVRAADLVDSYEGLEIQSITGQWKSFGTEPSQVAIRTVDDLIRVSAETSSEDWAPDFLCVVRKAPKPLTLEEVIEGMPGVIRDDSIHHESANTYDDAQYIADAIRASFEVTPK